MEMPYQRVGPVGPAARETRPVQSSRCIGRICDATPPNQLYIGDVRRMRLTRHVVVESGVHPSHITAARAAAAAAASLIPRFTNTRLNRIHAVVHSSSHAPLSWCVSEFSFMFHAITSRVKCIPSLRTQLSVRVMPGSSKEGVLLPHPGERGCGQQSKMMQRDLNTWDSLLKLSVNQHIWLELFFSD